MFLLWAVAAVQFMASLAIPSDGRIPCLVQDKLVTESVDEIACGAFHVAVLTSRSEVFTWGRVPMEGWDMGILKIEKHLLLLKH